MTKAIIILIVIIGLIDYALIVASARAEDKDAYMAYEAWKKEKKKREEEENYTDCQWR